MQEKIASENTKLENLKFVAVVFAALGITSVILEVLEFVVKSFDKINTRSDPFIQYTGIALPILVVLLSRYSFRVPRFYTLTFYLNVIGIAYYLGLMGKEIW